MDTAMGVVLFFWFCFFVFFVLHGRTMRFFIWVVCLSLCRYVGSVVDDGARTVSNTKTDGRSVERSVGRGRSVAVASRRGEWEGSSARRAIRRRRRARARGGANERV